MVGPSLGCSPGAMPLTPGATLSRFWAKSAVWVERRELPAPVMITARAAGWRRRTVLSVAGPSNGDLLSLNVRVRPVR